jgi:outer membrane lipoprotein-sorting protein
MWMSNFMSDFRSDQFRMARWAPAALLLMAVVAGAQTAPTSQPATDPALLEKLTALDAKTATVTDLSAKFEQQKHTAMLRKPIVSSGVIKARGAVMLWETQKPDATVMRVDEKSLQLFYVKQKILEVYPIEGKLGALAANPMPRLKTLREYFSIAADNDKLENEPAGTIALRLTPLDAGMKQHVDNVRVRIDPERGLVSLFELTDPDGERTTIRFTDYKVNAGLDEKSLALDPPAGTQVVHPLDQAP